MKYFLYLRMFSSPIFLSDILEDGITIIEARAPWWCKNIFTRDDSAKRNFLPCKTKMGELMLYLGINI